MNIKQTNHWFHPDVPQTVRNHLTGEHHTLLHKVFFGTVVSSFGLFLVHVGETHHVLYWLCHHIGYALHGLGLTPIFGIFEKKGGSA